MKAAILASFVASVIALGFTPANAQSSRSAADLPRDQAESSGIAPPLNFRGAYGNPIHMVPNEAGHHARVAAGLVGKATATPLTYNGGPVMGPNIQIFPIYWLPATGKLQNGAATSFSPLYQSINTNMAALFPAHGLFNIATQYYQKVGTTTSYVANAGGLGGAYVDTAPYPTSGCTDTVTPGNCLTDAQIQTEIARVMSVNGWTGGMNKIYMLYTSAGEGSCFDSTSKQCSYTAYCAYHSYFTSGSTNVIYANQPYALSAYCQGAATMPNKDAGDLAANVATHEITEAATDPLLNAWYDSAGNEIGDKCAWTFGTNSWTNPTTGVAANQMYAGVYFEMQQEYDNHSNSCLQAGPT